MNKFIKTCRNIKKLKCLTFRAYILAASRPKFDSTFSKGKLKPCYCHSLQTSLNKKQINYLRFI